MLQQRYGSAGKEGTQVSNLILILRKKSMMVWFMMLLFSLALWGCGRSQAEPADAENISKDLIYESSMELVYAEKFAVDYYEGGYALISITDGSRFLVIPENQKIPEALPDDIVLLKQPLNNVYLVASAVMDMFRELDALENIRFSGQKADGWYIEEAKTAMEEGKILYAGKYNAPDYELILSEGCSLAIENTMISHSPEVAEKLKEFSIPVMVDYSSYEEHPLGRVEWIKLYGTLLGKEEKAIEAFNGQAEILNRILAEDEGGSDSQETVAFFYITNNGTVNIRKPSDYVPKMIELAKGRYIFRDMEVETGSKSTMNMQMEEFYKEAKEADYLIYNSTIDGELWSVEELFSKSGMLRDFKAVKEGNVFCTTSDLYQQSMSIGVFIEDIHKMLSDEEEKQKEMQYLYRLK